MNIKEFILDFAENHEIKHIDDIQDGVITQAITDEIYLVKTVEVTQ